MDSYQGAPAPNQTAQNGNAAVLLGLYLLLLAFFILLVAISRIAETRSSAALSSVNGAFSTAADASPPVALAPIVTGPIIDIEEFQGRIRTAVEAALPVAEIVVARNGRVLRVRVSTNVAFVREDSRLSRAMPPFLERLAGAMRLTARIGGPRSNCASARATLPSRPPAAIPRWRFGGPGSSRARWSPPALRPRPSLPASTPNSRPSNSASRWFR